MSAAPAINLEPKPFVKTSKQRELLDLANRHDYTLAYGGARSAKSVAYVRNIFVRATKKPSNHLIVRFCYNHVRTSIGMQTIPFVFGACFKDLAIKENKADGIYTVPCNVGGESIVWLGGTDDKARLDKLLGYEYSTVFANECSQIPFEAIAQLDTRLAETSGLSLKFYFDCNPPGKKHWTHKVFFEGVFPDDEAHGWDTAKIRLNPRDNAENLPAAYLVKLQKLPKRQRDRFWEGLYLSDIEGALWTDQMINVALAKEPADLRKTVIALDPAVTNNTGSDECGIVVCSLDENREGVVHDDLSGKMSTRDWAQRSVNAYHDYDANCIVAEVNQGGDLVEDVIHSMDPNVKVIKVRAAKGKLARAEPISHLYEPEMEHVCHVKRMPKLETELTETVLDTVSASPNRLDALVWGLTYLMIGKTKIRVHA